MNSVSVLLGDGAGSFAPQTTFSTSLYPTSVALSDVNEDGKLDIVVAGDGSNAVSVLLGRGDGTFSAPSSYTVGSSPFSVATADLNGDGRPDVVTANIGSQNVSVLLNSASTQDGPIYTLVTPTSDGQVVDGYISGATVFADANGDGVWEPGEATTTTDSAGNFTLQNASGQLVMTGGVDISTGLAFTGTMTAPSGYKIVSPLTTVVNALLPANPSAADLQNAESKVLTAFHVTLGAGQTLSTLDPVAAAR